MNLWRAKAPEQNRTLKRGDKEEDNNVVIASNFLAIYSTTNIADFSSMPLLTNGKIARVN